MATAHKTRPPRKKKPRPAAGPQEQRVRLSFVDWPAYVAFTDALGEQHVRVTYADGEMEIMTIGSEHERGKKRLAALAEALAEELDVEIEPRGSMTFRREDLLRGMEPDECYWIAHASVMCGREDYDATRDPPPDLGMEVEITQSTLDRMEIYAKLKIPEVWCWDGETLRFYGLARGRYAEISHSRAFPQVRAEDLLPFLVIKAGVSHSSAVKAFRKWVRERIAEGWKK
jgi:Uma2 family endonuclease